MSIYVVWTQNRGVFEMLKSPSKTEDLTRD
jgi:hypothetical protein